MKKSNIDLEGAQDKEEQPEPGVPANAFGYHDPDQAGPGGFNLPPSLGPNPHSADALERAEQDAKDKAEEEGGEKEDEGKLKDGDGDKDSISPSGNMPKDQEKMNAKEPGKLDAAGQSGAHGVDNSVAKPPVGDQSLGENGTDKQAGDQVGGVEKKDEVKPLDKPVVSPFLDDKKKPGRPAKKL